MGLTGYIQLSMDEVSSLLSKAQTVFSYDGGGFFIKHVVEMVEPNNEEQKSILYSCSGGINLLVKVNEFPQVS